MSHIAKHRIDIKSYNPEILKNAVEYARKELNKYWIEISENGIVFYAHHLYRPITLLPSGELRYDTMDFQSVREVETVLKKYYLMVATVLSLKKMGYTAEINIKRDGTIQILGVEA